MGLFLSFCRRIEEGTFVCRNYSAYASGGPAGGQTFAYFMRWV